MSMAQSSRPGGPPVAAREADVLSIREGRLFIEELEATELVERFGSPIFVFSENQLRSNLRRIRSAFEAGWRDGPVDILPAFKANTMLATRHILSEEGAGADIYSPRSSRGPPHRVDPELVSVNGGASLVSTSAGAWRPACGSPSRTSTRSTSSRTSRPSWVRREDQVRVKSIVPNLWRRTDFSQASVPIDLGIQVYKSGIPQEHLVEMGRRVFAMPNVELVGLHMHEGRHHPSTWFRKAS